MVLLLLYRCRFQNFLNNLVLDLCCWTKVIHDYFTEIKNNLSQSTDRFSLNIKDVLLNFEHVLDDLHIQLTIAAFDASQTVKVEPTEVET